MKITALHSMYQYCRDKLSLAVLKFERTLSLEHFTETLKTGPYASCSATGTRTVPWNMNDPWIYEHCDFKTMPWLSIYLDDLKLAWFFGTSPPRSILEQLCDVSGSAGPLVRADKPGVNQVKFLTSYIRLDLCCRQYGLHARDSTHTRPSLLKCAVTWWFRWDLDTFI